MKVFITGGTGFIGSHLTRELTRQGFTVTLLTRAVRPGRFLPQGASYLEGDPTQPGAWQKEAADHDWFINLAGASIFHRWTDTYKKLMRDSRLLTTRHLVQALAEGKGEGKVLLSASAVGYYGFRGDEEVDEEGGPGSDFLALLAKDWEGEAEKATRFGVRVIRCRFGIVLGEKGGALDSLVSLFRKGLGSPLGSGRQWFSWIHQEDLSNALLFLLKTEGISGAVNCTSPHPVTNREMTRLLAQVLKKPAFLPPLPGFLLKLVLGEFGQVLLEGQRVIPRRLLDLAFTFRFPWMKEALEHLLSPKVP